MLEEKTRYTGIYQRHREGCRGRRDCGCPYRATVYSKREKRIIRKQFDQLAEARTWRDDAAGAVRAGTLRSPTKRTVREAAAELVADMKVGQVVDRSGRRYKPATIRTYERHLQHRVVVRFGDWRLSELRRCDVQEFADGLAREGLAPSTVLNVLDPLRVIYRAAVRRELVALDPTDGLELARPRGRRDRIASREEAEALLAALPVAERALWATALYAGLRRGELRALPCSDVDVAARRINVQTAWDDEEGAQDVKSEAGLRTVPILDSLAPLLEEELRRTRRIGRSLLFGMDAGRPFDPSSVRRRARAAWKAAQLEPIGLHEARHTFASLLIASGADAKVIQSVMGHASIVMTFDTYGHLMPDGLDRAAAAANAYLAAGKVPGK